ncbi:MAG TPA: argininosuccinate lyase [candidate division Zixibacteria bacterium]|nr:argininosuccinate lyase [candidate division Zixibacteria bacterium]
MKGRGDRKAKLWGGRFASATSSSVEEFTASIGVDARLYRYDIAGSIAHAKMLARQRIIAVSDARKIVRGLKAIEREIERGVFRFSTADEDIHMNIERRLIEKIGKAGAKLHTGRSRNDQVALDLRLFLRDEIGRILEGLDALGKELARAARRHIDVIMPGYTHLQRAQPVLFSHHLLAYFDMFQRDRDRFRDCLERVNVSPLGAGALAGTTYPVDPRYAARLLGFPRIATNSIDAVSDRDFALEFLSASAILFVHFSRLAEEMVLWSSQEFGFIELPDRYCTGSSMMPQKKNPDVPELVRGKAGRVFGHLGALLTIVKGLPLAYNRDMQEDKLPLFDTADTVRSTLAIVRELIAGLQVKRERMLEAARGGFMNATDFADYLVARGVPFRAAHEITGKIVRHCIAAGRRLEDLPLVELKRFSAKIDEDVYRYLSPQSGVDRRRSPGGTARANVLRRLKELGV